MNDIAVLAVSLGPPTSLAGQAARVLIMPAGKVDLSGADPLILDKADAERVIATFEKRGVDMPIDYEHASVIKARQGEAAPAVGWIKRLEFVEGQGLVASVEWGDEARAMIEKGEYKYLSPVAAFDDKRHVNMILTVGLTNQPRIHNQKELLAASRMAYAQELESREAPKMDKLTLPDGTFTPKLLAILNEALPGVEIETEALPEDQATEIAEVGDQLAAARDVLKGWGVEIADDADAMAIVSAMVAYAATLEESADDETKDAAADAAGSAAPEGGGEAEGSLTTMTTSDPANWVPMSMYQDALKQNAEALTKASAARVKTAIDGVIALHRINPNDKKAMSWANDFATKDIEGFEKVFGLSSAAPTVGPKPGRVVKPVKATAVGGKRAELIELSIAEVIEHPQGCAIMGGDPLAWINAELSEHGKSPLTDAEKDTVNEKLEAMAA
jgi:phage I-like protein